MDPDNKEILTFDNFKNHDEIRTCDDSTKEHYAVMNKGGQWWSTSESYGEISSDVVCEYNFCVPLC